MTTFAKNWQNNEDLGTFFENTLVFPLLLKFITHPI